VQAMRAIDVRHQGLEKVICVFELDGVLVDPGPQSCEDALLEALGGERPRALLLTHIHFDHAGASGALVRRWPDLPVYVHERGAPHMADPSRLVASASRLYGGEDGLRRTWGEVVPVPEANLRVLSGGETDVEGAFRVEYTPGHASHHVCYLHEPSGWAFVGDVAGVRIPPHAFTVAPTPPPDVDVDAWKRSLDLVANWKPVGLGLTHFGTTEDATAQLEACGDALDWGVELAAAGDQAAFEDALRARVREEAGPDAESQLLAAPPDHLFLGLDRWHRKQSGG
jgi:glyoxylase-like metal-dependent hydrolase (beta-lactamase superfamily II)